MTFLAFSGISTNANVVRDRIWVEARDPFVMKLPLHHRNQQTSTNHHRSQQQHHFENFENFDNFDNFENSEDLENRIQVPMSNIDAFTPARMQSR